MTEHPEYARTRRRALLIGWASITIGFFGIWLPLLPGTLFIIFGLSLISLHTKKAHELLAKLRSKHPHLSNHLERLETTIIRLVDVSMHSHEYVEIPAESDRIHGLIEVSKHPAGVAILLHAASDVMESECQNVFAEELRTTGATVVRFEPRRSIASEALFTNLTATSILEDLRAVIAWARTQAWWRDNLILAGHSVGGLVAGLYAQECPDDVKTLLLLAPTISGASYHAAYKARDPDGLATWKETGSRLVRHPLTHETHGLAYGFLEDMEAYNLMQHADALTMPTHIFVGTNDTVAPIGEATALSLAIGPNAQVHPLSGVSHVPRTKDELDKVAHILETIS